MDINILAPNLQTFFNSQADSVARSTKFVQRESKLNGALFLQTLVFGFIENPQATLNELIELSADLGVDISKQGLHDRLPRALPFLKQMFAECLALFRHEWRLDVAVLNRFSSVYITDSTVIALPSALQDEFPGCGGDGPQAAVKVQLTIELLSGTLTGLNLEAGRTPDQTYSGHVAAVQPDALYLHDLGYFVVPHFETIDQHNAYFLSRLNTQVGLFEPVTRQPVDLLAWARDQAEVSFERELLVGATHKVCCRVVGVRLPQEIVDRRRQQAHEKAQRKGRTPSARHLELLAWTFYITNAPPTRLSITDIVALYPVRWQIELIFKLWKSQAALDRVVGRRRARVLCELYAKLIGITITNCLLTPYRWRKRELSMVKAVGILRHYANRLALNLGQLPRLMRWLDKIIQRCLKYALKDKRKRLTTYQNLERLDEPPQPELQPAGSQQTLSMEVA